MSMEVESQKIKNHRYGHSIKTKSSSGDVFYPLS